MKKKLCVKTCETEQTPKEKQNIRYLNLFAMVRITFIQILVCTHKIKTTNKKKYIHEFICTMYK